MPGVTLSGWTIIPPCLYFKSNLHYSQPPKQTPGCIAPTCALRPSNMDHTIPNSTLSPSCALRPLLGLGSRRRAWGPTRHRPTRTKTNWAATSRDMAGAAVWASTASAPRPDFEATNTDADTAGLQTCEPACRILKASALSLLSLPVGKQAIGVGHELVPAP
jgi:hypothetical protein